MTRHSRLIAVSLLLVPVAATFGGDPGPTPAEREGFRATPDLAETFEYVDRLAGISDAITVERFGTSAAGRPLRSVVVAAGIEPTPRAAREAGRAVLLVQSGIHAGEIDGKDATLMLLREIALGRRPAWLENLVLVFVPVYNVDGHERISPYNRANQNGPVEGMGFRTTANGRDLNRDHLKLDTVEARRIVELFNRWRPDLHVDNHVTNGSQHAWVLTWSWAEAPQLRPEPSAWMAERMPAVLAATEAAGHRVGPYISLVDGTDPTKGFDTSVGEPRYATGYYPLRNRPSILVENHAYKPYRERVLANRDFMAALFDAVAADPAALVDAVVAADTAVVRDGRAVEDRPPVHVRYRTAAADETRVVPFHVWERVDSVALGVPILSWDTSAIREVEVPWLHRPEVALALARPWGYLVVPGWPEIEERLRAHGLRVETLDAAEILDVETIEVRDVRRLNDGAATYQGRVQVTGTVDRRAVRRRFPAGTLWIPADQPDFAVAVQLLEPEAPDSLFAWGHLANVAERKEYIATHVLEGLVRELLEDPAIAAEWEAALDDEAFAANPGARWLWWYRRTPYWDTEVGRLPIYRVMAPRPATDAGRDGPGRDGPGRVGP